MFGKAINGIEFDLPIHALKHAIWLVTKTVGNPWLSWEKSQIPSQSVHTRKGYLDQSESIKILDHLINEFIGYFSFG